MAAVNANANPNAQNASAQPVTNLDPVTSMQKLEEMLSQVEALRQEVRQFFLAVGTYSSSRSTVTNIQMHSKGVADKMRRLNTLGRELDGHLKPLPATGIPALVDDDAINLMNDLENEKMKEMQEKTNIALQNFESHLQAIYQPDVFQGKQTTDSKKRASQDDLFLSIRKKINSINNTEEEEKRETFDDLDSILDEVKRSTNLSFKKSTESSSLYGIPVTSIRITCSQIFRVFITFLPQVSDSQTRKQIVVDKIAVFGYKEKRKEVWEQTEFNIFQRIGELAREALLFFQNYHPDAVLKKLLKWISNYEKVFSTPCAGCKKFLASDSGKYGMIPPAIRTFDDLGTPYHTKCAPFNK